MPPYANREQLDHSPDYSGAFDRNSARKNQVQVRYKLVGDHERDNCSGDFVPQLSWDAAGASATVEETADPKAAAPKLPLMFRRLLDFNPCTDIRIKIANYPSSALFKIRFCSECGEPVHKLGGYETEHRLDTVIDEITGEESMVERKVYFHSSFCHQKKLDRTKHREAGFGDVLMELKDVVKSRAQEQKRREEEELAAARRLRALLLLQEEEDAKVLAKAGRKKGLARRAIKRYLRFVSRNSSRGGKQRNNCTEEATVRGVEI